MSKPTPYETPYLRDLQPDEYNVLLEDIEKHGQLVPIIVDENGEVIDGRNRQRIAVTLGRKPIVHAVDLTGKTPGERTAISLALNTFRRQMGPGEQRRIMDYMHRELGLSTRAIADLLGTSKSTVHRIVDRGVPSGTPRSAIGGTRQVLPAEKVKAIADTLALGLTTREVAKRVGVAQSTVVKEAHKASIPIPRKKEKPIASPAVRRDVRITDLLNLLRTDKSATQTRGLLAIDKALHEHFNRQHIDCDHSTKGTTS